jgi:hypothetical protein
VRDLKGDSQESPLSAKHARKYKNVKLMCYVGMRTLNVLKKSQAQLRKTTIIRLAYLFFLLRQTYYFTYFKPLNLMLETQQDR